MDIHNQLSLICQSGTATLIDSEKAVELYGINTFGQPQRFAGAIKVFEESVIPQLLKLANTAGFKLHPVSTNNNWGYGSILVNKDPVYLLDLSPLNSITPTNKKLGLITIGPGVTQQQLHDYLNEENWPQRQAALRGLPPPWFPAAQNPAALRRAARSGILRAAV